MELVTEYCSNALDLARLLNIYKSIIIQGLTSPKLRNNLAWLVISAQIYEKSHRQVLKSNVLCIIK